MDADSLATATQDAVARMILVLPPEMAEGDVLTLAATVAICILKAYCDDEETVRVAAGSVGEAMIGFSGGAE